MIPAVGAALVNEAARAAPLPSPDAGSLSRFAALLGEESFADAMSKLDSDQDGKLGLAELANGLWDEMEPDRGESLQQMVETIIGALEPDGDATIRAGAILAGGHAIVAALPPPSAERLAEHIITLGDKDLDEQISSGEIADFMRDKTSKPLQELLFDLLLDQKVQERIDQAAALCAA
ncbi:hypothetical protein [Stagnihabitans tardus]|uniref:EF-hand domain-containing protein n=1 Tax=Stagnihabitans tardus TaxID=2699202 RepID=A0AAE4Y841_9RHOB|nr:hypothetical protein [Stagnihabitans tardus]NBZ86942.1 hypothetical protein [Stagnihabitans tardus]